ncbi:MAG TPA: hypothetical protein VGI73_07230 [Solirubrobacterales bacterium]|jgi:hypothetical protein
MSDELPVVACSLEAGALRQRLEEIAAVGAESLTGRSTSGDTHSLRFRSDPATRERLERIVAAEAACCAFLDLDLRAEGDALVLTIAAPADGQPVADQLALAFGGS